MTTVSGAPQVLGGGERPSWLLRLREGAASFWIWALSALSARAPWFVQFVKPFCVNGTWYASVSIRRGTLANARRILGEDSSHADRVRLGKQVMAQFYEFFAEVGRNSRRTRQEMLVEVESIVGHDKLVKARSSKRGAVIAVAHLGSFEVATAALREYEEKIHVVFRREHRGHFEKLRRALHDRLGVYETPLDDGWGVWYHLRDRLTSNEVVLIQADRVMPGQRGVKVPFLHGHMEIPTGPIKLAMAAQAPIIPVFAVRVGPAKVRIIIEDSIEVEGGLASVGTGVPHPALIQLAKLIESYVARYPDQWLAFHPAWVEDQERV